MARKGGNSGKTSTGIPQECEPEKFPFHPPPGSFVETESEVDIGGIDSRTRSCPVPKTAISSLSPLGELLRPTQAGGGGGGEVKNRHRDPLRLSHPTPFLARIDPVLPCFTLLCPGVSFIEVA